MRHLVVLAHPRQESFNRAVCAAWVAALEARGHEVVLRDLYAMNFDPILSEAELADLRQSITRPDVTVEQDHVRWAEAITFVCPVWWISVPAILKGWIDRVFALGFAYGYIPGGVEGLLTGKRCVIFTTSGTAAGPWVDSGKDQAVRIQMGLGTAIFCGMDLVEHVHMTPVGRLSTAEQLTGWLANTRTVAERWF